MSLEKTPGLLERLFPPGFSLLGVRSEYDGTRFDLRDLDCLAPYEPVLRYLYDHYFRVDVTGWENARGGPALYVANHSGGFVVPELMMLNYAWWKRYGNAYPIYGLAHDFLFTFSPLARVFTRIGAVRNSREMAHRVLAEARAGLLVFPGGVEEMFRGFSSRNQIRFQERTGFIKLALREQVPIIPIVTAGAHEVFVVLSEGREIARILGLQQLLRVQVLPLVLSLPWGLAPGYLPTFPLPTKLDIEFGEPIVFKGMTPADAEDPVKVRACYDRVVNDMQARLDRMVAARPGPPVLGRLPTVSELIPKLEELWPKGRTAS